MRVLFVTFPWHSHLFPMVPLAMGFRAHGHEVRVASTPALAATVAGTGLTAATVGSDVDLKAMSNDRARATWHTQGRWPEDWPIRPELLDESQHDVIENLGRMQSTVAGAMLDDLLDFGRWWRPDLVVHDAVTLAGPVVASALGVPNISHLWGTPGPQRIEVDRSGESPIPEYAALYRQVGAEVRMHPTAWVDPSAPGMRYPIAATCRRMRYVPYNGVGRMPRWLLEDGRPRIVVTWGGTADALRGSESLALIEDCIGAAAAVAGARQVVAAVTAATAEVLRPAHPAVRIASGVPLQLLMSGCDAVVHHGGAGTSMTAAAAGVPQLVIAQRPEPSVNAARLEACGVGRRLVPSELPPAEDGKKLLEEEITAVLTDPVHAGAAVALRDGIDAQPSPASVVGEIAELAERDGS